MKTYVEVI